MSYNYGLVWILEGLALLICLFIYMYSYNSPYIKDPIEKVKTSFLDAQFGGTIIYLILLMIINSLKEKPAKAMKCFTGLFILATIFCSSMGFVKMNMDNKYTVEEFAGMYSEYYLKDEEASNNMWGFSMDGSIKQTNSKELFNEECLKLYDSFTIKVMVGFLILLVILLLNGYLIIKTFKSSKDFDKVKKEDEVLFDEEENIKV